MLDYISSSWRGFIRDPDDVDTRVHWVDAVQLETWTHLAMTWDGAKLRLYANGMPVDSADASSIKTSTSWLGIGLRSEAGFDDSELDLEFKGKIEEVQYFNRPLSATEIANVYNAGSAGKCKACDSIFNAPTDPLLDGNPNVQQALHQSLLDSGAFSLPPDDRRELAGYVYENTVTGEITARTKPLHPQATPCNTYPGAPVLQPDEIAKAVYHPHPFSVGDTVPQACWENGKPTENSDRLGGGSKEDWEFIDTPAPHGEKIPSYIIDKDRVYRLDPDTPQEDWHKNPNRWDWNDNCSGRRKVADQDMGVRNMRPAIMMVLAASLVFALQGSASSREMVQAACLSGDEEAVAFLDWAVALGTDPSQRYEDQRSQWKVPLTTPSEIEAVTGGQTCDKVRRGYNKGIGDSPGTQRDIYAVRVGSRYIAYDPTVKAGEFVVHIVLNQSFKFVASLAS